jgi:hypothetical protein
MGRRIALIGIALAVGVTACGGGGGGDATSVSAPADSSPSVNSADALVIEPAPLPVAADVGAESVTAVLLASSGFEIDADLVAASEAVEADLLAQATAGIGPQGIRRPAQTIATAGGMSAVGIFIDLVSRLTTGAQQPYSASFDSPTTTTANGTLTMGAKLSGDGAGSTSTEISFEAKVETPDGRTVTERITGTVAGPVCPDEFGLLDLEISGEMEVTGNGSERSRHTFKGTVSATFDDNGGFADLDLDLNVQSDRTSADGRTAFVDMTYGIQATNPFGGAAAKETAREPKVNRASQSVTSGAQKADYDMINNGEEAAMKLVTMALAGRVSSIQNNGCVVVVAEAPGSVGAKQVVPIDVKTRHVVEGVELDKRVEVTLSGEGSIDPSSLPKTPEKVNYTAGEKGGDTGTLSLVSRSRRGIGNTTLTIKVADRYRVDAPAGVLRLQGPVCSLDAPFTLSVVGEINGTLTFTPTGPDGGTYAGSADLGRGSMTWSGGYTVTGRDTESPSIDADEGTTTLVGPVSIEAPSFWAGTGPDFPLIPDAAACP